jgi:hypothetical protein
MTWTEEKLFYLRNFIRSKVFSCYYCHRVNFISTRRWLIGCGIGENDGRLWLVICGVSMEGPKVRKTLSLRERIQRDKEADMRELGLLP